MAQEIGLHSLKPKPGSRHKKKRVGRGEGSGLGKTSGRGHKGAGARSGAKRKVNFEGGQMPIHMRLRKQPGPNKKTSMPFEQYGRTHTQPVNLKDLEERFDAGAEVTPESLREKGLATRRGVEVKILGQGELTKKLTVKVHRASRSAQEKIQAAGGSVELVVETRPPKERPEPAPPSEEEKAALEEKAAAAEEEPEAPAEKAPAAEATPAEEEPPAEEASEDAEEQPSEEE
jgi:large subunit ribosomal protein L15